MYAYSRHKGCFKSGVRSEDEKRYLLHLQPIIYLRFNSETKLEICTSTKVAKSYNMIRFLKKIKVIHLFFIHFFFVLLTMNKNSDNMVGVIIITITITIILLAKVFLYPEMHPFSMDLDSDNELVSYQGERLVLQQRLPFEAGT